MGKAKQAQPHSSIGPESSIRVLIADDHPLFAEGVKDALQRAHMEVVGIAATGAEAIVLAARTNPDIVLLDVRMPDIDGLQALKALKAMNPHLAVVILTTYDSVDYLWSAVMGGAAGYLLKGISAQELAETVRRAVVGESALDPAQLQKLMACFTLDPGDCGNGTSAEDPHLTGREAQVLLALASGMRNPELASLLDVNVGTLKTHLSRIFHKICVSDRTQAVIWSYRHAQYLKQKSGASNQQPR